MSSPARAPTLPAALWALMAGNFVIGTGVMIVPGTLNDISTSLAVPVPVAGQLISAAALMMCLGAPVLASLVGQRDRRQLLTLAMLWYGLMHLLCAVMPGFASLMLVRVLAVVSPAIFTPQAAACIGLLVPAAHRGRAISLVFLGWSVASVLGMPVGAWIGGTLGWRAAFAGVGLLSLASAWWVYHAMPKGVTPPVFALGAWRDTLRSRPLMLCIGVTVLSSAGQFVQFAYLAPYLKAMFDSTPLQLSLVFAWFGAFGFLGNLWVSHHIDRLGASRAVMVSLGGMALSLALWPLGSNLLLAALVLVPWALGCFAANSAQQARLSAIAPALAAGSIALNTSAIYAGQAIGAAGGGWLIGQDQMALLHWAGLGILGLALLVSRQATQAAQRHPHHA